MNTIESKNVSNFFEQNGYVIEKPHCVGNNKDTVFISAGIQPLLKKYRNMLLPSDTKIFIPQPVIRSQYINDLCEGTSLAFVNATSSIINNSEEEYISMVKDWYDFLCNVGLRKNEIITNSDYYVDKWGDIYLEGKRTFYYYNNVEIGDSTFFTKVKCDNENIPIESMCDLGFGLERIRWAVSQKSYYDLFSDSLMIPSKIKALLSAISLLSVNDIKPSNKNMGYRARLFSKKLVEFLEGRDLNKNEINYLKECIIYWRDWQSSFIGNIEDITKEYVRNGNRFLINRLSDLGYTNLPNIDINLSREEFLNRLNSSGFNKEIVKKVGGVNL